MFRFLTFAIQFALDSNPGQGVLLAAAAGFRHRGQRHRTRTPVQTGTELGGRGVADDPVGAGHRARHRRRTPAAQSQFACGARQAG